MPMKKIKNKTSPCNCSKSSQCIRCPCHRLVNGIHVVQCTDACECSKNCLGKQCPKTTETNTENVEVTENGVSNQNLNKDSLMSLTVSEFKELLKRSLIECQLEITRDIQVLINQQAASKNDEEPENNVNPLPNFQSPLDLSCLSPSVLFFTQNH